MPIGFSLDDLRDATSGTVVVEKTTSFRGATIDGRTLSEGEVYFAVAGERFDGHDFCGQAVERGAAALVVERGRAPAGAGVTVVEVDDARKAFGGLGRLVRRRSGVRVVAITGSAGKTTTKDLAAAAAAGALGPEAVLASEGSLNNETGVPWTLVRLEPHHRVALVEMGMRGVGQIDYLTGIAEPDVGVVINAGVAHVGVVGSVEAIARGKSEVWSRLGPGGVAVRPAGDPRLEALCAERAPAARQVTFGREPGAVVRVVEEEARGPSGSRAVFEMAGRRFEAQVPVVGSHNVDNAACALAVCLALGLDPEKAVQGIANARAARYRSEVVEIGGRNVLLDCYNANPASMRAALVTLKDLRGGSKAVAVLGDMLELGDTEWEEHALVGTLLPDAGVDHVVVMGALGRGIARGARQAGVTEIIETDDPETAARAVASWTDPGDWILVKASRGMRLERVADALKEVVV